MKAERSSKSSAHVDRGKAWFVCVACHICNVVTVGYSTSLGVFFIEWKDHLDLSATSSSWVVGIPQLVASPLSLFMGAIASQLGIRRVAMLGAVVNGLATILGSFSTHVWHLYLSGAMSGPPYITSAKFLCTGIGFAMVVCPALLILSHYFKKRFAVANGLFVLGVSTGQIVFPPLFRLLVENYGWRGAMLIAGAIQMNGVVACALFRPLKGGLEKVGRRGARLEGSGDERNIDMNIGTAVSDTHNREQTRKSTEYKQPIDALQNRPSYRKLETEELNTTNTTDAIATEAVVSEKQLDVKLRVQDSVSTELEKDGSAENEHLIGEVSSQHSPTGAASNQSCPEENNKRGRKSQELFRFLEVFSNHLVMLLVVASCFLSIGMSTNVAHLPARVKEAGWSEDQGALVLSICAIPTIVTRATHGWFVDRNYIGAFKLQSIVLLGCAIITSLNPASDNYIYLVGYGVFLGAFLGIAVPLIFYTVKSAARPSQVPISLGLILCSLFLFNGAGPVIAGKIYDATGNYVAPFLAAGAMFLGAFILNAIVGVCKSREQVK